MARRKRPSHAVSAARPRAERQRSERIYGIHAARAALANPARKISAIHATPNAMERLVAGLPSPPPQVRRASAEELSRRLGADAVHQGVLVEAEPLEQPSLQDAASLAGQGGPLVVLDQVTDPHNVGAVLRSAAAFNASALIMTRRHSPPLDGALAKAASGAVEHVPVILVANLARALDELAATGISRIGFEGSAERAFEDTEPGDALALVFGAEHKGLRRLTAEHCDLLCRLETGGAIRSLNVSNAAAIALHWVSCRRR